MRTNDLWLAALCVLLMLVIVLLLRPAHACPTPEAFQTGAPVNVPAGCPTPPGVWRSPEAHRARESCVAAVAAERDALRVDLAALQSRYVRARATTARLMLGLSHDLTLAREALLAPCVCDPCPTLALGTVSCAACGIGAGLLGWQFGAR